MPTVLRYGPYRVYFYSHEPNEPPHVHVDHGTSTAKLWLGPPVALASSHGFGPRDLRRVQGIVEEYRQTLEEAWHAFFGKSG